MNLKEQYAALLAELRGLAAKAKDGTLTDDEATAYDTKSAEARTMKTKLDEMERRAKDADFLQEQDKHFNQGTGSVARTVPADQEGRAQTNEREPRAPQSLGQRFLADQAMAEFRKRNVQGPSPSAVEVRSFWHPGEDASNEGMTHEQRAAGLVYSGALPSNLISPMRVPGMFGPDMPVLNVRSAFLNGQTDSNLIEFYRELAYTNAADFVAEATATSPTTLGASGVKPESGITWERAEAPVGTIATWMAVTNQLLQDAAQLRSVIEGRLLDFVALAENAALLKGTGTPPEIRGLMNVSGIQDLDAAYFSSNPVTDAGEDNEDYNRIKRGARLITEIGRATANFVMLSPADDERFSTTTDANRQYMAGGPFAGGGFSTLWGYRKIVTEELSEGEAIVGDGRMAAVWDRMAAQVMVGYINDQFIRNMQTLLAEERVAFTVYRPAAFAVIELTSA